MRPADLVQRVLHLRHEAHVRHLVGLVEHHHPHVAQRDVTAVQQVVEAARRRDDNVDAGTERLRVAVGWHTAEDGSHLQAADLPDQVTYVLGADFGVSSRFTFVLDVLGSYLIDAPRLNQTTFHALDGRSTFPTVTFTEESYNLLSGAVGFKLNVVENLLVDVNLLFNLDNNGLRDKITPLVGFEYAF